MPRPRLLFASIALSTLVHGQTAVEKIDMGVLYVGSAESRRTDDFVEFLNNHFTRVGTAIYPQFTPNDADPYDVVVLDAEMRPSKNSIGIGPQPQLPADYSRATILVNGPGVIVADRQLHAKLDWL